MHPLLDRPITLLTKKLRATLPIHIFISPNMPPDEGGRVVDGGPDGTTLMDIASHAPPVYGEHVLDQLYADMEMPGLVTPLAHSAAVTPFNLSRAGSYDNLQQMTSGARTIDGIARHAVLPDVLEDRLQNLNSSHRNTSFRMRGTSSGSGVITPHRISEDEPTTSSPPQRLYSSYGGRRSSTGTTQPGGPSSERRVPSFHQASNPSRNASHDEENSTSHDVADLRSTPATPEHIDYAMELGALSRVPSYQTAVKTPARVSEAGMLPDYTQAMSRPASPEARESNAVAGSPAGVRSRRVEAESPSFVRAATGGLGRLRSQSGSGSRLGSRSR